jgi:cytochrome b561
VDRNTVISCHIPQIITTYSTNIRITMRFTNNNEQFGLVAVSMHWIIALLTLGLFMLGWWMVELDYYDNWYQLAPWWHKGLGVMTLILLILRWGWSLLNPSPLPLDSTSRWQQKAAHVVHFSMNSLILLICVSGYLIVTAKGKGLAVFDWFTVPSFVANINKLEDLAGDVHYMLAYLLIALVLLHIFATLIHHFAYKDKTLKRMFGQ